MCTIIHPWLYWIPHTVQPRIYFSLILNITPFFSFKKQLGQFSRRKHLLFMWKRTHKLISLHLYNYYTKMRKLTFSQGEFRHNSEVEVNIARFCLHCRILQKQALNQSLYSWVAELQYDVSHTFFRFLNKKVCHAIIPVFTTYKRLYQILTRLLTFHSSCFISPTKFYQQRFPNHLSCSATLPLPNYPHQQLAQCPNNHLNPQSPIF